MRTKTVKFNDDVLGWIHKNACGNEHCVASIKKGLTYHATPRVGLLSVNHFATMIEAEDALLKHNNKPYTRK